MGDTFAHVQSESLFCALLKTPFCFIAQLFSSLLINQELQLSIIRAGQHSSPESHFTSKNLQNILTFFFFLRHDLDLQITCRSGWQRIELQTSI